MPMSEIWAKKLEYTDIYRAVNDPFYPRFWPERLYEPVNKMRAWGRQRRVLHQQDPKGIFVCDMSDLFGIGIPEEWTRKVLDRFQYCPQHRFYLLTKQPQNLIKFSPFPDNCWVGVTATNTEMLMQACSYLEYPLQAKVKYISIEPFLDWNFNWNESYLINLFKRADINWLIIGALTGTKYQLLEISQQWNIQNINQGLTLMPYGNKWTLQPPIEWVQEIVRAADKAGIKVFLKDNLKPLFKSVILENTPCLAYALKYYGGLRQEMPK